MTRKTLTEAGRSGRKTADRTHSSRKDKSHRNGNAEARDGSRPDLYAALRIGSLPTSSRVSGRG